LASQTHTRIARQSEVRAKRFGVPKKKGYFNNKYRQLRVSLALSPGLNKVLQNVMTITFVKNHDNDLHLLV
jgi:hypothetical protein